MRLKKVKFSNSMYPCLNLWNVVILYDGSVRLCGCQIKNDEYDDLVVGNIFEKSLKEI